MKVDSHILWYTADIITVSCDWDAIYEVNNSSQDQQSFDGMIRVIDIIVDEA